MSRIKPIQATPELSGEDAIRIIEQVNKAPSESMLKRNELLRNILKNIRK